MIRAAIELLRVRQWIKNAFVLVPGLFSLEFLRARSLVAGAVALGSFCLMSSAVYITNDILDRERDRAHPRKRNRPIARGSVSIPLAAAIGGALAFGSVLAAAFVSVPAIAILGGYLLVNLVYSLALKHLPIVDVLCIGAGFILRISMGAMVISVELSSWILVTTLFVSLFLGFAKRASELEYAGGEHANARGASDTPRAARPVLSTYTPEFLNAAVVITLTLSIISYSLYAMDPQTVGKVGSRGLLYTLPFVVYGTLRYLHLVCGRGTGEDPAELILKDVPLIADMILWLVAVVVVLLAGRAR